MRILKLWDADMKIKGAILMDQGRDVRAFSLVEVLVSVGILGFMMIALFSAFGFGFASIATTREDLRATQILMQKVEAIRLCTWKQLASCPTSFQDTYDPTSGTNESSGIVYGGTLDTAGVATNLPAGYQNSVRLITVGVTWTNYTGKNKIVHTRQLQTLSARYGIQNYVYGTTNQ